MRPHSHATARLPFILIKLIASFLQDGLLASSILGLLSKPADDPRIWFFIRKSIAANFWTLCRLFLLISLIASIPVFFILGLVALFPFHIAPVLTVGLFALYVVFLKYALADPLVVVEGHNATTALQLSWRMTRGHFGYVVGCYVLLVIAVGLLVLGLESVQRLAPISYAVTSGIIVGMLVKIFAPLRLVLSWVMYNQIKGQYIPAVSTIEAV